MLVEISIVPLGLGEHLSGPLAEVLDAIDRSGIPYRLTPSGTCLEVEWDEVLPVVRECHRRMRARSPHVFTTIRIEDEEGVRDKLTSNVASVEEKLRRRLAQSGAIAT
jgi:uncharacterized protein (TIGR00106 family)